MVKHIVAWNYADGFTEEENRINAEKIKYELENLINLIEGIVSIQVSLSPLDTSDSDLILESVFETEEALKAYQIHPEHVRAATIVRQATKNRKCLDYFI